MKTLFLTSFLFIASFMFSQDMMDSPLYAAANPMPEIELNLEMASSAKSYGYNESSIPLGLGMMMGGATFIVAGLLTQPTYVGGSTTQKKPFVQQPRTWPILSGAIIFTSGIVISIGR